jgi:hypothetical protein
MGLLARGNGLFGSPINIEEAAAACVADCTGGEGGEEVGVADLCRRPRPLTRFRLTGIVQASLGLRCDADAR